MTRSDSGPAQPATPLDSAKARTRAGSAGARRTQANPERAQEPKPRTASKTRAQAQPPGSTPLDWGAPRRAAAQQAQGTSAAPRGRFYNIKGSTKEATAGIIAAKKVGNLRRAQQIRDIVKAHPLTDTSSAAKAARRGLIRKAIQRLDQPDTPDDA